MLGGGRSALALMLLHTGATSCLVPPGAELQLHGPPVGAPSRIANLPLGTQMHSKRSNGHPFGVRRLSNFPHTFLLENFLAADECDTLIARSKHCGLEAAETSGKTQSRRNCKIAMLSPAKEAVVASVQSDAARLLLSQEAMSLPGGGCEDLHVLCYQPGGEYKCHYDGKLRLGAHSNLLLRHL